MFPSTLGSMNGNRRSTGPSRRGMVGSRPHRFRPGGLEGRDALAANGVSEVAARALSAWAVLRARISRAAAASASRASIPDHECGCTDTGERLTPPQPLAVSCGRPGRRPHGQRDRRSLPARRSLRSLLRSSSTVRASSDEPSLAPLAKTSHDTSRDETLDGARRRCNETRGETIPLGSSSHSSAGNRSSRKSARSR